MPAMSSFEKVCITGGAGFIGSHLVTKLCDNNVDVVVLDNLSAGKIENVETLLKSPNFRFVHGDLLNFEEIRNSLSNCEVVFHLAANPEVRVGSENPEVHYEQNIAATFNLLEAVRKVGSVRVFVFSSSSTVYGEPLEIPTPEDYAPLKPVSVYGASKMASEALISGYAQTYGFNAIIYRLANIVGPRSQHGVIFDFMNKLTEDSERLEILGDGTQTKSYLDVEDAIDAMLTGVSKSQCKVEIFNVGSEDKVNVKEIADIVCEEMSLSGVEYVYTGGIDGGRGWKGDVKVMLLNIERIKKLGWKPKLNSCQAVRKAARALLNQSKREASAD
jgi:UDP-glucose 4-epimerase